jgi:arginine/lysine/ornithine decarboxylase
LPLAAEDVAQALDGLQQRVGAVLVTSPTYEGLCADLSALAHVRSSLRILLLCIQ